MPGDDIVAAVCVVTSASELPPCSSIVTVREFAVHWAYNVVFDAIDHVDEPPAENAVPEPFAAEFHPANVYPVRTNDPELADAVNDDPYVALPDDGTVPPVNELPSYVTV